jgi:transcriptional regulator GlxA family with amidase domain
VLENRLFVEDGNSYSSAGVTAGIDLMLQVVSQMAGHRCAAELARYLVVYIRRTGADSQLSPWLEGRNHIHPSVQRVQDAIAADPRQRLHADGPGEDSSRESPSSFATLPSMHRHEYS